MNGLAVVVTFHAVDDFGCMCDIYRTECDCGSDNKILYVVSHLISPEKFLRGYTSGDYWVCYDEVATPR